MRLVNLMNMKSSEEITVDVDRNGHHQFLVTLVTLVTLVVVLERTQWLGGSTGPAAVSTSHHGRFDSLPFSPAVLEPDFNLHFG